ncbi:MAG TPA: zinc-dependent metalloprotease, partial [bacterium]|nr:zinc-dependent metalloprotease [bacterium]
MRFARFVAAFLILALAASPSGAKPKKDDSSSGSDGEKKFEDVVKDLEKIEGLFTFYFDAKENKYLMEIRPYQLGTVYLCSTMREAGDGLYYDSGSMGRSFPFVLERTGKTVQMLHKNVYYRADQGTPIEAAVARGVTSSVFGSAEVECEPDEDGRGFLIDPAKLFLKDHWAVGANLGERKLDYSMDKDGSRFGEIKSFPKNSEIETVIHFTSNTPRPTEMRIPDSRSMTHRYRFSLVEIPETDYVPRLADDRVGHFTTQFQDFTNLERDTPYTWYINRWHLKKQDPSAAISPPVEPIVYWISNTVPEPYRDAVREGATLWNVAFEKAGFQDAVVVKQMPDDADWDPADARYNTIQWIVQPGGGYAVGPSHANPFTGQLYAADVRVSADFVRAFFNSYEQYVNPLTVFADVIDGLDRRPDPEHSCSYSQGLAAEAGFGTDWMTAQSFDPESPEFRQYVHDGIVDLIAHEVGHTLGFRHNFRASTIHDLKQVHDLELTRVEGVSGSVMDYNPVNIAPEGETQGSFWCTSLGAYDYWVVEYAYTPTGAASPEDEQEALDRIASKSTNPLLTYATDEDAFGFGAQGIDPVVNMWDMGPDPVAYYDQRLDMSDRIVGDLEKRFGTSGARYPKMRTVFGRAMRQRFYAAATVAKQVGGIYHRRDHVQPGGASPFDPVPADKQRAALDFLDRRIFADDAFEITPELANKLAPERLDDFDDSIYYAPRVDYPIHELVLSAQGAVLNRLYHPITLNRLLDMPYHVPAGEDVLTMAGMFRSVRGSIWREVAAGSKVSSTRRNLQ